MKTRITIGIIIIIIGIGMLLDRISGWSFWGAIGDWWPIILVIIGLVNITKSQSSITFGIIMIFIGSLLLSSNLDLIPLKFWDMFWPLLLILLGIALLTRYQISRRSKFKDKIDIFTIFGSAEEHITTDEFTGGNIFTVFGGCDIDLSESMLNIEGANLELSAVFGGIQVIVPTDWKIKTKGIPLFGGMSNNTEASIEKDALSPVLNINYTVIFGGVEITNKKKKYR